jgi:hypothetical protein
MGSVLPTWVRPGTGDVFVAEPDDSAPAELLATLPESAGDAVWSPGCAEAASSELTCGRYIAVATRQEEGLLLWLLDADTGEARELGRFRPPPIGGTLWHSWTADGAAVIGQAYRAMVAFPLDGSGPRPLVVEAEPGAPIAGELSPDGALYARLERDSDFGSSLVVGDPETGQEVEIPLDLAQAESFIWSGDGRYLLVNNWSCRLDPCRYEVWAADTGAFPDLDEAILIAEAHSFLGALSALQDKSTEVDSTPWAAIEGLPAAGPPETWERRALPEAGLSFAAPPGWRVQIDGYTFTMASYQALVGGLVAVPDEHIHVYGRWSGDFGATADYGDLAAMKETHFNWDVVPVEAGDVPGVILHDRLAPVCEHVLLPHAGGELEISYCPATEKWRAWMLDFLAGMELEQ